MAHSGPRYDSYRPYDPTSRQDIDIRRGYTWTPGPFPASHDQPHSFKTRHHNPSVTQSTEPREGDRPKVPQVYDREIDRLIGRTIRAYRLVTNYQRDCPTGHRWMPDHIEMILLTGENLETDREALESLRLRLARDGGAGVVGEVRGAAYALRNYCEEVQELIRGHERVPMFDGKEWEWDGQGRSVGRNPFFETGGMDGVRQVAGRARHESPVEQRHLSPLAQPGRHNSGGIRREARGYFATDT